MRAREAYEILKMAEHFGCRFGFTFQTGSLETRTLCVRAPSHELKPWLITADDML